MMKWESIHISDKIHWLKDVVMNSSTYKKGDEVIIEALITGSNNTFSGDVGFNIQPHHMKFMRELWDEHIVTQKDNSIINVLREKS